MRALAIAVCCFVLTGCTFGIAECDTNRPCKTAGALCVEGFCTLADASTGGGSGGGATGGGGGSTTGGGTATGGGTTTGGGDGTGGGGQPMCPTMGCAEACIEGTGCVPWFESIRINSPDAGASFREGMVRLEAELIPTAGIVVDQTVYPGILAYSIDDGGTLALTQIPASARYTAQYTASACGALKQINWTVSLEDGGLSKSSTFGCDGEIPTIYPPALPSEAVRRDERFHFELNASEPVTGVAVSLDGIPAEETAVGVDGGSCSALGKCWIADFSKPSMRTMNSTMSMAFAAKDLAGNIANTAPLLVSVTRERWSLRISGNNPIIAAPAVDRNGLVYVGNTNGSDTGNLVSIDPVSKVGADAGISIGAVQGIAVATPDGGSSLLFVVYNDSNRGHVRALNAPTLSSSGLQSECGASGTDRVRVAPALVSAAPGRVAALTVSVGSRVLRWESQDGCSAVNSSGISTPALAADRPLNAIVVNASADAGAVFVDDTGAVDALVRIDGVRGENLSVAQRFSFDAGGAHTQSLFLGDSIVANLLSLDLSTRIHRANPLSTSATRWTFTTAAPSQGTVAIASDSEAYVGIGKDIIRFSPTSGGGNIALATASVGAAMGEDFKTSPVLLAAPTGGFAWGYAVSTGAKLIAFPQSGNSEPHWVANLRVGQAVNAHPGFGCNTRPGAAPGTGVLYVAYDDGYVQAIIVDGPKLQDGPNAWPKYQRSMGNAGNDDTAFFPTNWTCP